MSLPGTFNITDTDLDFYSKNRLYNNNNNNMTDDKKPLYSIAGPNGNLPPPPPLSSLAIHSSSNSSSINDTEKDPPRKRTRTTPEQLAILEKSFTLNPSPNNRTREQLSHQLGMSERSIQIWFQNRRAKVKNQAKRSMVHMRDSVLHVQQQYAANAAAAACQTIAFQQGQETIDPNLYYYYYYYYFHQQQQQAKTTPTSSIDASMPPPPPPTTSSLPSSSSSQFTHYNNNRGDTPFSTNSIPDLTVSASTSSSSITSGNRRLHAEKRSQSVGPYPYYHRRTTATPPYERPSSLGPIYHTPPPPQMPLYHQSIIMEEERYPLTSQTLQIGSWKRVCDIQCQLDLGTRTLVWYIGDEQRGFRIDIPLDTIQCIRISGRYQVSVHLHQPQCIRFFMSNDREWTQCHDFTQDKQASVQYVHVLEGDSRLLQDLAIALDHVQELKMLVVDEERMLDPFQQQHLLLLQSASF